MKTSKKIMVYSRDPGAANCVMPVFKLLSELPDYQIDLIGKDYALKKYADAHWPAQDLSQLITEINQQSVADFLKTGQYDLIFSGVGSSDLADRLIWRSAQQLQIPTVVILDQWLNYRSRFSLDPAKTDPGQADLIIPDKICVMDELAKAEMIREGFDPKILVVTGQPYFETVPVRQLALGEEGKRKTIETLNLSEESFKIIFVSEPIKEFYPDDYLGYNQLTILKKLIAAVEGIIKEYQRLKVDLVIKLHPRNNPAIFNDLLAEIKKIDRLKITIDGFLSPDQALAIANLLVGMSSALLIEAAILNKPLVSLQIGLKKQDPFILSRLGKTKTVLTEAELLLRLNDAINGKLDNKIDFILTAGSALRVKRVIDQILWPN